MAVILLYILVSLKPLLLRPLVMLNQTILKHILPNEQIAIRLVFVPSICLLMQYMWPVLDLRIRNAFRFRNMWKAPHNIVAKYQSILPSAIREQLSDGLFTDLDSVFPGLDLLQKYWLYTTSCIHSLWITRIVNPFTRSRTNLFITPIPTAKS